MLTNDSQISPGNKIKVGGDEVVIVDQIPSSRGGLLVAQGDGPALSFYSAGDLLAEDADVEHVSGPVVPGADQQAQSADTAKDNEIASLKAKLAQVEAQNSARESAPQDPAPVESTVPTDPTVPDNAPSDVPHPGDPSAPQVVQEG